LEQVSILVAIAAGQLSWPLATQNALNATIAAHTLSLIEQVAAGMGETTPDVDEAAVVAALNAAGFAWDGSEWGRGD
jgi:anti-sigma factor ChrR (cupin superfamily)